MPRSHLARFLAGVALAVGVLEIGLRVIEITPAWRVLPVIQRQFAQPDPVTGYSLRPGVEGIWVRENRARVSINSFGMRDRPTTLEKPPGTLRVLLLGDSETESIQVDWSVSFDAIAEELLGQELQTPVEILNLGLSGANPLIQLLRMRHLGLPMDPDLAVYLVKLDDFVYAPLRDDRQSPGYVEAEDGSLVLGRRFHQRRSLRLRDALPGRVFFWLMDHSRVAALAYNRHQLGLWAAWPKVRSARQSPPDPCARLLDLLRPMHAL